jgi:hypothetical protein
MTTDLGPAFERRLKQLNAELADMRQSSGSQTLTELLGRSMALTVACADQLTPSATEFAAIQASISDQEAKVVNQLQDAIDKAQKLHDRLAHLMIPTGRPLDPLMIKQIRSLPAQQLEATEILLRTYRLMSDVITMTFDYLYLDLQALLEGTDDAAVEAFLKAIKNGALDALFSLVPLGHLLRDLLVTLFHGTIDAIHARKERLENANKYLVSIEKYNAACDSWVDAMKKYIDSLRQSQMMFRSN